MTVSPTLAWDEHERMVSLYETAAREAVLHGDGTICLRVPTVCAACGEWSGAVWFHSRGWVCTTCEEATPGVVPTDMQRRVRCVTDDMVSVLLGDCPR